MSLGNSCTVVFSTLSHALARFLYALSGTNLFINAQAMTWFRQYGMAIYLIESIYWPISNIFD